MTKRKAPNPTDAELAILQVLWHSGPLTVRQVYESLLKQRHMGYTTVLKMLQIMTEKGLVERDESSRSHVYRPRLPQAETQRQLVGDLLDKAFAGSAARLVMSALSHTPASRAELEQVKRLLDKMEGGNP